MKKGRGFLTIGLFALAATLLSFSVVGSSRAVLTYRSNTYGAKVDVDDIGVTLVEKGAVAEESEDISWRNYDEEKNYADELNNWTEHTGALIQKMIAPGENFKLGTWYPEELSVKNSGRIDEYVRVTLYKYWVKDGVKQTDLDPKLIKLNPVNEDVWYHDESSDTAERMVFYYKGILEVGEPTLPFIDRLMIEAEPVEATVKVDREEIILEDGRAATRITTTYSYDGVSFVLEATVDAVQTHNAEDAIKSAWGVDMSAKGMG